MGKSTFLQDFKAFAMKGNVVDMAVGIIIGAAFGKIVSSLVSDLLMPLVGALVGGVNFTDWKWTIVGERASILDPDIMLPAVTLNYGNFIQVLIDFIIIAFCVFLLIKGLNRLTSASTVIPIGRPRWITSHSACQSGRQNRTKSS